MELARKLANDSISVCGVDPGAGKTRIALMWWLLRTSAPRSLIVALPRQVQVTGLFHLIEKDLAEVADGWERTCVEGFFDGSRQHFSGPSEKRDLPSTSVDIRIVVFDRLLSPTYRRDQFSEYLHMLYSDLVLDEFHEFSQQHLMRPALREILQIRAWLTSGGRTLLLSGTPDPGLSRSLGLQKVFGRSELQDFQQRKVVVRSVKPDSIEIPKKDALISFNTVTQAQTCYLQLLRSGKIEKAEDVLLVHSFFVKEVRRQKVEKLLDDVKNSKGLPLTITSKMLQSSYDLDYGEGLLFLSLPNTDVQTIGRINRFGHRDGKVTFVHESEDDVLFRKICMDFLMFINNGLNI
jgi:hypothetical protein